MATAKKLPSGSWRCLVFSHVETDPKTGKKKRIYKSFTCDVSGPRGKRIAEQMAAEWAAEKEAPERLRDGSLTLSEAVNSYIDSKSHVLSESTIIGYRKIQRNYMGSIASIPLNRFDRQTVQRWVDSIAARASVKTVKNAYGLFSAVMRQYQDKRFSVKFPQKMQEPIFIPSDDDIKRLLANTDGDFQVALYLAAFAGLRRGEICALTREDVYDGYIAVNKSMGMTEGRGWKVKPPKTESSNRKVNVPKFLTEIMEKKAGRIVEMTPDQLTDRFCVLRDRLGMKDFRLHDLRHYYVSANHALGVPDQYIMAMGGWNTDRTMKAVYRNTIAPERDKFAEMSVMHFEKMQHEMQHEKEKST